MADAVARGYRAPGDSPGHEKHATPKWPTRYAWAWTLYRLRPTKLAALHEKFPMPDPLACPHTPAAPPVGAHPVRDHPQASFSATTTRHPSQIGLSRTRCAPATAERRYHDDGRYMLVLRRENPTAVVKSAADSRPKHTTRVKTLKGAKDLGGSATYLISVCFRRRRLGRPADTSRPKAVSAWPAFVGLTTSALFSISLLVGAIFSC
jgi:hypothetical protein